MFSVLCKAFREIICEADVEVSGAVGEDVNEEEVVPLWQCDEDRAVAGTRKADSSASLRNDKG